MPVFAAIGAIIGSISIPAATATAAAAVAGGAAAVAGTAYSVVKTEEAIAKAKRQQNAAKAANATAEGKIRSDAYALKFGLAPQEGTDLNALCKVFNGRLECFATAADAATYAATGKRNDTKNGKVFTPAGAGKPKPTALATTNGKPMAAATIETATDKAERARVNSLGALRAAEKALEGINSVKSLVQGVIGQNVEQQQQQAQAATTAQPNTTVLLIAAAGVIALVLFLRK